MSCRPLSPFCFSQNDRLQAGRRLCLARSRGTPSSEPDPANEPLMTLSLRKHGAVGDGGRLSGAGLKAGTRTGLFVTRRCLRSHSSAAAVGWGLGSENALHPCPPPPPPPTSSRALERGWSGDVSLGTPGCDTCIPGSCAESRPFPEDPSCEQTPNYKSHHGMESPLKTGEKAEPRRDAEYRVAG